MIWKDPVALLSPLNRDKNNTDIRLCFYYSMNCRRFSPRYPKMKPKHLAGLFIREIFRDDRRRCIFKAMLTFVKSDQYFF